MLNLDAFKLGGVNKDTLQLETSEENNQCATALVQQSRRTLEIASRKLDPLIYDQINFSEAMRKMALTHSKVKIRIIVWEPEQIIKRGHRLLELVGKLSSFIEVRRAGIEHNDYNAGLLVVDSIGYLSWKSAERYDARASFSDRRQATLLRKEFDEMWDAARPDPNFRRIAI